MPNYDILWNKGEKTQLNAVCFCRLGKSAHYSEYLVDYANKRKPKAVVYHRNDVMVERDTEQAFISYLLTDSPWRSAYQSITDRQVKVSTSISGEFLVSALSITRWLSSYPWAVDSWKYLVDKGYDANLSLIVAWTMNESRTGLYEYPYQDESIINGRNVSVAWLKHWMNNPEPISDGSLYRDTLSYPQKVMSQWIPEDTQASGSGSGIKAHMIGWENTDYEFGGDQETFEEMIGEEYLLVVAHGDHYYCEDYSYTIHSDDLEILGTSSCKAGESLYQIAGSLDFKSGSKRVDGLFFRGRITTDCFPNLEMLADKFIEEMNK